MEYQWKNFYGKFGEISLDLLVECWWKKKPLKKCGNNSKSEDVILYEVSGLGKT